ncbi:GCN5-related N-acetyltransferase 10, chloroplastic-like isoform X2 [Lycium barbarum]|uniref:GCN5-related N-acetyltransferase 10, chloroplastic-like isoform X2 n=1 Tax=Lycium barbarum TaxID=112863 RepID=UPI00293E51C3|nr:GCN5-related N-acetyltransferase 10, chloroplastic-like isoform X2 [Lycium barbarum]
MEQCHLLSNIHTICQRDGEGKKTLRPYEMSLKLYFRYACLVAEASSDTSEVEQNLVGVIDATVYRDNDVLQYLPGAAEYIYISEIVVLNKFRRQKVATALLKACDVLARFWGFLWIV